MNDFIYKLFIVLASAYVFVVWCRDYFYFTSNGCKEKRKGAFAGATPATYGLILSGGICGLLLAFINTGLECAFGVSGEQSIVVWFVIFSWLAAAFIEELVFRGYLYIHNRSRVALWSSVFLMSVVFALCHPYLWNYEILDSESVFSGVWTFNFSIQSILSTFGVFACSLVFYFLRFCKWNVYRSLLPCVAAHFAYNLAVFGIKAVQGFVEWNF